MQAQNMPNMPSAKLPIKVPFSFAASALSILSDQIESGTDITPTLMEMFQSTEISLSEAVDRRIAFSGFLEAAINHASDAAKAWATKKKQLEQVRERFLESTKQTVEENPSIPFKGELGRLAIQQSPPAVDYDFEEFSLDESTIEMLGIEPKYVVKEVKYRINKKDLLADLKAGVTVPWARLKQDTHLRIRK